MRLTMIANQTSRDPGLVKRCLTCAYLNRLTKLNQLSKANKWYSSADFPEAKKLLDTGCLQLEEGIDYEAMSLKWYWWLVRPLSSYPGMDDHDNANQLRTISPSVPPADNGIPPADLAISPSDHGISPADHWIPVPPPSPDKSRMLPPRTPSTVEKEMEKDGSNVGGLLLDLAVDGSVDGTSTPAKDKAGTIPPAPTEKDSYTIPPAPTGKEAGTTPPAPNEKEASRTPPALTRKEAGTTPEKPTDSKQKGTSKPDRPGSPSGKSSSSEDDDNEDEEYVSCFLEWLGLDPDCKRMLDDETKMLAHHERQMRIKAIPIFQQAVNEDPELFMEARTQITAAVYTMREILVRFDTWLGNISYFACGQGKWEAGMEGDRRKRVCKE